MMARLLKVGSGKWSSTSGLECMESVGGRILDSREWGNGLVRDGEADRCGF